MNRMFNRIAHLSQVGILSLTLCTVSGCAASESIQTKTAFLWGPVEQNLGETAIPTPNFTPESKAAKLREELLAPVNRYAPSDKDWRFVRGTDKGPTIFGMRLSFDLHSSKSQVRVGAVRRGSNRTYGPQIVMTFDRDR